MYSHGNMAMSFSVKKQLTDYRKKRKNAMAVIEEGDYRCFLLFASFLF